MNKGLAEGCTNAVCWMLGVALVIAGLILSICLLMALGFGLAVGRSEVSLPGPLAGLFITSLLGPMTLIGGIVLIMELRQGNPE